MLDLSARQGRRPRVVTALFIIVACATSGACGALGPAAKDVTKGSIRGAYEEMDTLDDGLRERVARKVVDSPAVQAAAHDLFASVVTGSIDGLTIAERDGKISAFVDASMKELRKQGTAAMGEVFANLERDLAPVLRSLIRELVTSASVAFREAAVRDLPAITSAILDSTLRAFAVAASTASDQLRAQAKGFAQVDLAPIMGVVSQEVARQSIVGVREGLHQELNLKDPQVREGMREIGIGLAQGIAQGTPTSPFTTTFAVASFILAILLLVSLGAVVSLWTRARMSAKVIAILAQRLDGGSKSEGTVEDAVNEASDKA